MTIAIPNATPSHSAPFPAWCRLSPVSSFASRTSSLSRRFESSPSWRTRSFKPFSGSIWTRWATVSPSFPLLPSRSGPSASRARTLRRNEGDEDLRREGRTERALGVANLQRDGPLERLPGNDTHIDPRHDAELGQIPQPFRV